MLRGLRRCCMTTTSTSTWREYRTIRGEPAGNRVLGPDRFDRALAARTPRSRVQERGTRSGTSRLGPLSAARTEYRKDTTGSVDEKLELS